MPPPRIKSQQRRADKGAAALGRGQDAGQDFRELQFVAADHRHHDGEGKGEDVDDDGDQHDAQHQAIGADVAEPLDDVAEDIGGLASRRFGAVFETPDENEADRVESSTQKIGAGEPNHRKRQPAEDRPHHPGEVVGRGIERDGGTETVHPRDLAEQGPADRKFHRDREAEERGAERDLPDLKLVGRGEPSQDGRGNCDKTDDGKQHPAPVEPVGEHADHRRQKPHRCDPREGHQGDKQGRAGAVEHIDADCQHLEPAYQTVRHPRHPEPDEIGLAEKCENTLPVESAPVVLPRHYGCRHMK